MRQTHKLEPIDKPLTVMDKELAERCLHCQKLEEELYKRPIKKVKVQPVIEDRKCKNKVLEVIKNSLFQLDEVISKK